MRLMARLKILEQRHTEALPPMVFFEPTEAELADFEREYPGRDCICFVADEDLKAPVGNTIFLPLLTTPQRRHAET